MCGSRFRLLSVCVWVAPACATRHARVQTGPDCAGMVLHPSREARYCWSGGYWQTARLPSGRCSRGGRVAGSRGKVGGNAGGEDPAAADLEFRGTCGSPGTAPRSALFLPSGSGSRSRSFCPCAREALVSNANPCCHQRQALPGMKLPRMNWQMAARHSRLRLPRPVEKRFLRQTHHGG